MLLMDKVMDLDGRAPPVATGQTSARLTAAACTHLFVGTACYGAVFGVWRCPEQALLSALKLPLFVVLLLIGGLSSNILFGPAAVAGYLVTGLGDAVGEPVGTRFGRHTYAVPSCGGVRAVRSWEGSAAVFVACLIAFLVALGASPHLAGLRLPLILMGFAAAATLVAAASPHGWDNATLQIVPSFLAWLVAG